MGGYPEPNRSESPRRSPMGTAQVVPAGEPATKEQGQSERVGKAHGATTDNVREQAKIYSEPLRTNKAGSDAGGLAPPIEEPACLQRHPLHQR